MKKIALFLLTFPLIAFSNPQKAISENFTISNKEIQWSKEFPKNQTNTDLIKHFSSLKDLKPEYVSEDLIRANFSNQKFKNIFIPFSDRFNLNQLDIESCVSKPFLFSVRIIINNDSYLVIVDKIGFIKNKEISGWISTSIVQSFFPIEKYTLKSNGKPSGSYIFDFLDYYFTDYFKSN